jgi:hypothetical protein
MSRFLVEVLDPLDNLRIGAGGFYRGGNFLEYILKVMWGHQKCDFLPIIGALKKAKNFNYILPMMN